MHISNDSGQIKSATFANASAVTAIGVTLFNSLAWYCPSTSLAAAENTYVYDCDLAEAPKATGETWAPGDVLYWDNSAGKFTKTSTSNTACGYAGSVQASGDTTGAVIFLTYP